MSHPAQRISAHDHHLSQPHHLVTSGLPSQCNIHPSSSAVQQQTTAARDHYMRKHDDVADIYSRHIVSPTHCVPPLPTHYRMHVADGQRADTISFPHGESTRIPVTRGATGSSTSMYPTAERAPPTSSGQHLTTSTHENHIPLLIMTSTRQLDEPLGIPGTARIYLHGYIMWTFGYREAREFFTALLKNNIVIYDSPPLSSVPGLPESCSIVEGPLPTPSHRIAHVVNGNLMLVLDYSVDLSRGPVVPQTIWQPLSGRNRQRFVTGARLELPIFFVHEDGTVGVTVADALSCNCATLRGFCDTAPLGDQTTKHFGIQASLWHLCLIIVLLLTFLKWPGYQPYKRQFQMRDETSRRSTISLKRLVAYVGRTTEKFFQVRHALLDLDGLC